MHSELFCHVCEDLRHYRSAANDAERIYQYLSRYFCSEREEISDRQLWNQLAMDKKHVHVMCGHCHKAPEAELRRAEENLQKLVYTICKKLENGEKLPLHTGEILRCLQGYYPMMWKAVHRAEALGKKGKNE